MNIWIKNGIGVAVIVAVALGTGWTVRHFHRPGQLDVISAQAMDMNQMRPPTGAAPVALASVRQGSLADTVTYTGTVVALNEQDVSPRITGTLVSLPVYPGNPVQTGQVLARLDTSQVGPQAAQAKAQAREAMLAASVAHLTHHLHHEAELAQATAQSQAAQQIISDSQAEAKADQDAIADALANVKSAQAQADYWRTEIVREKQLADAGAASRQEYEGELAQAQSAQAALSQAQAKVEQAKDTATGARGKVQVARHQAVMAQAGVQMARADIAVAQGQEVQADAGAAAAEEKAQASAAQQGYARLIAPFNGVITARPVAPGTLVQPGTVILKVAEIDRVRVQANVAIEDLSGVHVGSPVSLTIEGGDRTIAAHVTSVFPAASDQTRTATVETIVPNPGHRLLPGAFVTMRITKRIVSNKVLVPASAIVSHGGQSYVWTATGGASASAKTGMKAHEVAVQISASDGTWTEMASDGLNAGTPVVTHGQAGLTEGVPLVATTWSSNGPQVLPSATAGTGGKTLYRCEKCGMTYSAADAQKDGYVDPMDGGRLVPVTGRQKGQ